MVSTVTNRAGVAPEEGIKAPCVVATTSNITLSGLQTIGSVTTVAGDRVIVTSQTDASENGIWIASTSAWSRAYDFNDNTDITSGVLCITDVQVWQVTYTGTLTIGTTNLTFTKLLDVDTTGSMLLPDGTVSNPALKWATGLGIYRSSDTVSVAVGGIEAFRVQKALRDGSTVVQKWGSPDNWGSIFPEFMVDHTYSNGGFLRVRSMWLGDAGDGTDLGQLTSSGTEASPTPKAANKPLGSHYWLPYDSSSAFLPGEIYSSVYGSDVFAGDGVTVNYAGAQSWNGDSDYAVYVGGTATTLGTLYVKDAVGSEGYTKSGTTITFNTAPGGSVRIEFMKRTNLSMTGPFYGRCAQINARTNETPTADSRGGSLVFYTIKDGEVAVRQRAWISNKGYFVAAARGSYEDNGSATYPDSINVGSDIAGVQGAHHADNTEGWGNVSIIASDRANAACIAIRKYNATTTGIDFRMDHSGNTFNIERVTGGGTVVISEINQSNGTHELGKNGGVGSLIITPVSNAVNSINARGSTSGNDVSLTAEGTDSAIPINIVAKNSSVTLKTDSTIAFRAVSGASDVNYLRAVASVATADVAFEAVGSDTNINIQLNPKGNGVLRFGTHTAIGAETVTGYITIQDSGGTSRKIAVVS